MSIADEFAAAAAAQPLDEARLRSATSALLVQLKHEAAVEAATSVVVLNKQVEELRVQVGELAAQVAELVSQRERRVGE